MDVRRRVAERPYACLAGARASPDTGQAREWQLPCLSLLGVTRFDLGLISPVFVCPKCFYRFPESPQTSAEDQFPGKGMRREVFCTDAYLSRTTMHRRKMPSDA